MRIKIKCSMWRNKQSGDKYRMRGVRDKLYTTKTNTMSVTKRPIWSEDDNPSWMDWSKAHNPEVHRVEIEIVPAASLGLSCSRRAKSR